MVGMAAELWVVQMGRVGYREGLALQERLRTAREEDRIEDTLLLLEHDPVYTKGRRTGPGELPLGEEWYRAHGIDVVDTPRGGKVTYHGPDQITGYAIMRLDNHDVQGFVRRMEAALVAALADAGVDARTRPDDGPDFTGVWAGDGKIASIGVHVRRGITAHGFALNVANDLQPFGWIVPCGLDHVRMTSVAQEQGVPSTPGDLMACMRKRVGHRFAAAHGRRQRLMSLARVLEHAPEHAVAG